MHSPSYDITLWYIYIKLLLLLVVVVVVVVILCTGFRRGTFILKSRPVFWWYDMEVDLNFSIYTQYADIWMSCELLVPQTLNVIVILSIIFINIELCCVTHLENVSRLQTHVGLPEFEQDSCHIGIAD